MNRMIDLTPVGREPIMTLRDSEMRYRRLFEAAQDGIFILNGDSGEIVDANPFIAALLGYKRSDFFGKELWNFGFFSDAAESKLAFSELQEKGYIRYDDLPLRTSSGRQVDVEFVSNRYLVNGVNVIQCNIRDITRRKQIEDRLRKSESLNRNLVEHLPHKIIVKDRNSVILLCNANYADGLGLRSDEIVGKDAFALYPREQADIDHAIDQQVMTHGISKDFEEPYQNGGAPQWIHTIKVPFRDERGKIVGIVVVIEDVTARKVLEEQARQSQKLEAIGQLAGGIAHDFNNLLTGILGYCDLISCRLTANDPLAADIDEIRKCGERAKRLTYQLLAFSRMQNVELKVVDLNALIASFDDMLRRLLGERIDLQTSFASDLGQVKADAMQIEQIMVNLAINARDAMPGGGKFTIETANVEIEKTHAASHNSVSPGRYVMLAVSDNGCGMDKSTMAKMFEPFFTTKDIGAGTGLGLASIFGIVKQSGGHIWCDSEPKRGTTIQIYLPRSDEVKAADPDREVATIGGSEFVLVVDDDEIVRKLIVQILGGAGYNVIVASNGNEALRESANFPDTIDLLITDMAMPGMNGYELMQKLTSKRPQMKVLFISGYTGEIALNNGMLGNGYAFLKKPFSKDTLIRKIREILDH